MIDVAIVGSYFEWLCIELMNDFLNEMTVCIWGMNSFYDYLHSCS